MIWINIFYVVCLAVSVVTAVLVLWHKVPTHTSGTVGLTLISLVAGATATDWLDSIVPRVNTERTLLLWAGFILVIYWLLGKPWRHHIIARTRQRRHDERRQRDRRVAERRGSLEPYPHLRKDGHPVNDNGTPPPRR